MAERLYSLYRKITVPGKRRANYVRESQLAFPKQTAIRVFQNALLNGAMTGRIMELRPIGKGLYGQ